MGITAKERNDSLAAVNSARTKWGLGSAGSNVSTGATISATNDVNNLNAWLKEAKTKSGSSQAIPSDVSSGTIIKNPFSAINSAATNIKNYCRCYGNCTGSCSNSCSGSCRTGCTYVCAGSTKGKSGA